VVIEKNGFVNITKLIPSDVFLKWTTDSYVIDQLKAIAKITRIAFTDLIIHTINEVNDKDIKGIYVHQKIFYLVLMQFSPKFLGNALDVVANFYMNKQKNYETKKSESNNKSKPAPNKKPKPVQLSTKKSVSKSNKKSESTSTSDSGSGSYSESDSDSYSGSDSDSDSGSYTESDSEPKSKSRFNSKIKSVSGSKSNARSNAKSNTKSNTKKTPNKKDKPAGKKPLNAYQQFTAKRIPELKKLNPNLPHKEYMKLAGAEWTKNK
jgi:hypothetical protein